MKSFQYKVPFAITGNMKMTKEKETEFDKNSYIFIKEKKMKDTLTSLAFNKTL